MPPRVEQSFRICALVWLCHACPNVSELMKTNLTLITVAVTLCFGGSVFAQDAKKSDAPTQKDTPAQTNAEKPKATQDELESTFKATLTKATLQGRWCSIKDGRLGPEKEDKYTILGVSKLGGDTWLIRARIQYGKTDLVAPIPVQVKWAGDTPIIMLDKAGVPGSGEYSARVMIYEKTYAGTWSGGDHGGLLNGVITVEKE